jgi:hypothetical protein
MRMQRRNVVTLAGLLVIASCLDRKTGNRTDGAVLGGADVVPAIPGTGGVLSIDADRIPDVRYSDVPPSHDVPIWGHETGGGVGGTGGGVAVGGNTGSGLMAGGGMSGVDSALLGAGGTVATGGGPVPSGGLLGGGGGIIGSGGGPARDGGSSSSGTGGKLGTGGTTGLLNGEPCTTASEVPSNRRGDDGRRSGPMAASGLRFRSSST